VTVARSLPSLPPVQVRGARRAAGAFVPGQAAVFRADNWAVKVYDMGKGKN